METSCNPNCFKHLLQEMENCSSQPAVPCATSNERRALFAGSFDPFTIGHADIVRRALLLFDKVFVVVAVNPAKHYLFTADERVDAIRSLYQGESRVEVVAYEGMMADLASQVGARFVVRGVRSVIDFEYEKVEADFNKRLGGLETVLLYSSPSLASVSSTAYRQLVFFHKDAEAAALLPSTAEPCPSPKRGAIGKC